MSFFPRRQNGMWLAGYVRQKREKPKKMEDGYRGHSVLNWNFREGRWQRGFVYRDNTSEYPQTETRYCLMNLRIIIDS